MDRRLINKLVLIMVLITSSLTNRLPQDRFTNHLWKCVPIQLKFCQNVGYNQTIDMSINIENSLTNYESQDEIEPIIKHFEQLAKTGCSQYLKLLVCSVFVPVCVEKYHKPIIACRHLCENVKSKCLKYLENSKFQIEWPEKLNCSQFHERNTEGTMCLDGGLNDEEKDKRKENSKQNKIRKPKNRSNNNRKSTVVNKDTTKHQSTKITSTQTYCNLLYPRNSQNYKFVYKLQACSLGCMKDGIFKLNDKITISKIISVLSFLCLLFCTFAILVIIINYRNICYPARPIIYITISYFLYSIGFIMKSIHSREKLSCVDENKESFLLVDGSGNVMCAASFLLTYCFYMAQHIWWIILCMTWALKVGLKYPEEYIKKKSKYYHMTAWGVPCSVTVAILVLRKIDVNELTGMCFVGQRLENIDALREFIIGPIFTYFVMGVTFISFGVISSQKFNIKVKNDNREDKSLMNFQIGVYAIIHAFVLGYTLVSYLIEYSNKQNWYLNPSENGPNFYIFLLRILMIFFNGILASFWILGLYSPKIFSEFRHKLLDKLLAQRSPQKQPVLQGMEQTDDGGTSETSI